MDGPFGPATQLLAEISLELSRLTDLVEQQQAAHVEIAAPHVEVLPTPVVVEGKETVNLAPLLQALEGLRTQPVVDSTPALMALLAEITAMREQLTQQAEIARRSEEGRSMLGAGASVVTAAQAIPVKNDPEGAVLHVTVDSLPAGGGSNVDVTDRAARLLGHVTIDTLPSVSGSVAVTNLPSVQPVSDNGGTLSVDDGGGSITVDGTVGVSGNVDVTPAAPAAADYLPVRLTDGAAFYTASGSGGGGVAEVNSSGGVATTVGYGASDLPMPIKTQSLGSTYIATADAVAFAANKSHFGLFNGVGSGKVIKVRKVFAVDNALTAVTGVAVRFDFRRSTAQSVGTAITPVPMDSASSALPAQVSIATGATVTDGSLLWPFTCANDEVGATQAFPSTQLMQYGNLMMEGDEIQELTLREGEGFTIKQITSTTVGSFAWIVVFTVE